MRPICTQCTDSGREMDCEYTDNFNATRTELLEDQVAQLQRKLRDLEAGRIPRAGKKATGDFGCMLLIYFTLLGRAQANLNVQPYGATLNMESAPANWWDYEPLLPNISKYL